MKIRDIVLEGGNAIPNSTPVNPQQFREVMQRLGRLLPNVNVHAIGSAGHKPLSGDVDVLIDQDEILKVVDAHDAKAARAVLAAQFRKLGLDSRRTGVSVHVGIPVTGGLAQVDIMIVPNAASVARMHQHDYRGDPGLKGGTIFPMVADLIKAANPNHKLSPWRGVVTRDTDELVTNDKDEIAVLALGPGHSARDLGNPAAIRAAASKSPERMAALGDRA